MEAPAQAVTLAVTQLHSCRTAIKFLEGTRHLSVQRGLSLSSESLWWWDCDCQSGSCVVRQESFLNDIVDLSVMMFTMQIWGNVMDTPDPYLSFGSDSPRSNRPHVLGVHLEAVKPLSHLEGSEGILKICFKRSFQNPKAKDNQRYRTRYQK